MFSILNLILWTLVAPAVPPTCAGPFSYAQWGADSAIARSQGNGLDSPGNPLVLYEHGELQWALKLLYERTKNKTYFNYIKAGVDNIVDDNGKIGGRYNATQFELDSLPVGPTFLYLYNQTGQTNYKVAADELRAQLSFETRTAEGQFWNKKTTHNQGWLDGTYMGDIFYASYTQLFQPDNQTAWDDTTSQFILMYNNTLQTTTTLNQTFIGLLHHGYHYSHTAEWADLDRGHSPEIWLRAVGWYSMALVDALDILPASHPGRHILLSQIHALFPRIVSAADLNSGVWWLVMTQSGRVGNHFESSGSAMFVYSLLKAVRLGYPSDSDGTTVAAAKKAYGYMVDNWVVDHEDGTVDWKNMVLVGSLNTTGSYEYYVEVPIDENDLKGVALFILASIEFEQLK